jgi:phosphoribosylformylglycinamidine synthase subunit PurQ / glutaminase
MQVGVLQFPGSNCDDDCVAAVNAIEGCSARKIWHQETALGEVDALILPGGFSYGDYLRCGAIARFSPVMEQVQCAAFEGKLILGICNGFQILCEAGLLPGALVLNQERLFRCHDVLLSVENTQTAFTNQLDSEEKLRLPIAHGEGRYVASSNTLQELEANQQIVFRYTSSLSDLEETPPLPSRLTGSPNGSFGNIAGIISKEGNVLGMMPHPERATTSLLGNESGLSIFESMRSFLTKKEGVA